MYANKTVTAEGKESRGSTEKCCCTQCTSMKTYYYLYLSDIYLSILSACSVQNYTKSHLKAFDNVKDNLDISFVDLVDK